MEQQLQQQILSLQQLVADRDEQISRLELEAGGAAQAVLNAQNGAANALLDSQQRMQQIARLENKIRNPSTLSPSENVLKKLQTPHILRDLPCFDGNPIKLHQFLRAIDNIMPVIEEARGLPMYNVWIQCIRSKITGDADTILELYGTELSWDDIKGNLITHYNDKRDEVSLTRDLFKLSQVGTVEEFYGKVSHVISLLLNQLCLMEENRDVRTSKKRFYQDIGLKVFLAGLKEPLGPIIRAQAPDTMKEALRLCAEESNYNYVRNPCRPTFPPVPPKPQQPLLIPQFKPPQYPPIPRIPFQRPAHPYPPRPNQFFQQQPMPHFKTFQPFQPAPLYRQPSQPFQPFQPVQFRQQPIPHQQFQPPQQKPVPMEVDPSVRTRQINYMNRNYQPKPALGPHYQLEIANEQYQEFSDPYYPDPDYEYFYPPHVDTDSDSQIQQSQPTHNNTPEKNTPQEDREPDRACDNLNFQIASDQPQMT